MHLQNVGQFLRDYMAQHPHKTVIWVRSDAEKSTFRLFYNHVNENVRHAYGDTF